MEKSDFMDFNLIRSSLNINSNLFGLYVKEIFADLSSRHDSDKEKGISEITFNNYFKLPIYISKKIFSSMDLDNDNYLNFKEFNYGMNKIFLGNFEETAQMIFSIYDFDKDGTIRKSDVKLLLSYLPIKSDIETNHKHQMESMEDLDEILSVTFGKGKETLNFSEYLKIIENKISDIYVQLICFIYYKKPFETDSIYEYTKLKKNKKEAPLVKLNFEKEKRFPSPSKKTKLQPAEKYLTSKVIKDFEDSKSSNNCSNSEGFSGEDNSNKSQSLIKKKFLQVDAVRMPNRKICTDNKSNVNEILKTTKNFYNSPTAILKGSQVLPEFNLEASLIKMNLEDQEKEIKVKKEDWIYTLENDRKLTKIFVSLFGSEMTFYQSDTKDELISIQNLSGCFLKNLEKETKTFEKTKYYGCSITVSKDKVKYFYFPKFELKENWVKLLKKAIGYETFSDIYEVNSTLGEGLFGVVKKGVHKKTNQIVAVKIIAKEKLQKGEIDLIRTEIDLMKLFRHPNIVKLIDHFECSENIYIVMEYLEGGTLTDYLESKNKKLSEKIIAKIIYCIGIVIKYINSYGVIHRDLKPENIMLSDKGDNPTVKLIDFGLTRTLADGERLADGFGTVCYVAPEVLTRKPYNKQIDIWSMGVILYFLLTGGKVPFDDEDKNDEKIAKKIILLDPSFPQEYFCNKKSLISFLNDCLNKDPEKRINIDNFIKNDWIKMTMSSKDSI